MTLTLEWPGELNISYVVIDPTTKRVFSSDLPIPTDCQKLNTFENRYVKINDIFDLFSGQVQDDAKWILQELLERFNVKQLVNVASKVSESATYLPVTTLLAFAMIWPCCKAFQSLCKAIQQFLESSSESLCNQCGWTKRECYCKGKYSVDRIKTFLGYVKSSSDAFCQTDFVYDNSSENVSTLNQSVNSLNLLQDDETNNVDMQQGTTNPIENGDLGAKLISSNITESLNNSASLQNTSLNYVHPLTPTTSTSDSAKDCSATNVFNLTYHGFHDVNSGKKRKQPSFHHNEEPKQKRMRHNNNRINREYQAPNGFFEGNHFMNRQECSAGVSSSMTLNIRGNGDKSGEANFWIPVDDEGDSDQDGRMIKKFRHIVFDDVIIRCLVPKCGQCFETLKAAEIHERTHLSDDSVESHNSGRLMGDTTKCLECSYRLPFNQWYNMLRHMETTHGLSISSGLNSCSMCGLNFDDIESLEHHMEFHSNSHYRCMYCGITLFSWHQVEMHMVTCNKRSANTKDQKIDIGCPYCVTLFQKRDVRNIHLKSHSDRGFMCMFCMDKTFTAWKALKKHYDLKHPKQIKRIGNARASKKVETSTCSKCSIQFKNSEVYAEHMVQVHQSMPTTVLICDQCNRHFNTEKSLNFHMKEVHTQEIPCEKCPYVATSASLLKIHANRKHASDHTCTQCNANFSSHRQLRMHMARHALKVVVACDQQFDHPGYAIPDSYSGFGFNQRPANKIQARKPQIKDDLFDYLIEPDFTGETIDQPMPINEERIPNGKRGRRRKGANDGDSFERQQKELLDKMRGLLKETSARTRTFKDSSTIKNLNIEINEHHDDGRLTSSPSTTSANEEVTLLPASIANRYPYSEHSYCKFQPTVVKENLPSSTPANKILGRPGKKNKPTLQASSPVRPETPSFDNCTAFPLRTTRRQAALIANKEQVSYCYAPPDINSSIVAVHNPLDDWDLDSMTSKMTESELLAENELLKGLGDYGFMQDMLTSLSPSKIRKSTSVGNFVAPPDLEKIDLSEVDAGLLDLNDEELNAFLEHYVADLNGANNSAINITKSNHRENGKM